MFNALQLFAPRPAARAAVSQPRPGRRPGPLMRLAAPALRIAAVVALAVGISWGVISHREHNWQQLTNRIVVPAGQRINLTLQDGTSVWLNAGTTFSYPTTFGTRQREVELDGEAYFDVTHNEEIPFVVHTSQMDIEVLGTEFNVEAYSDTEHFETSLIQGCVKVSSTSDPEQHVTLAPSQKTTMLDGQLVVENIDDYNVYRWREGLYCFRYKSFADILKDLEKYFDIEIRLENPRIAGIVLTGKFRIPEGLDFILKVLQLDVEFSYSRDIEHNIVYIQ